MMTTILGETMASSSSSRSTPRLASRGPAHAAVPGRPAGRGRQRLGLEEFERLDVEQAGRVADDVGVPQGLQKFLRPLEIPHPDANRAQSLGDMGVRARA